MILFLAWNHTQDAGGGRGGVLCKHMLKGFLAVSQATPLQLEKIEGSSYIASINVLFVGLHPTMLQRVKGCLHLSALQHQNETKKTQLLQTQGSWFELTATRQPPAFRVFISSLIPRLSCVGSLGMRLHLQLRQNILYKLSSLGTIQWLQCDTTLLWSAKGVACETSLICDGCGLQD